MLPVALMSQQHLVAVPYAIAHAYYASLSAVAESARETMRVNIMVHQHRHHRRGWWRTTCLVEAHLLRTENTRIEFACRMILNMQYQS